MIYALRIAAIFFSLVSVVYADCTTTAVTSTYSSYISVAPKTVSVSFEPDALGSEATATVTLKICSRKVSTACLDYDFDSDADGVADTNILDGVAISTTGVKGITGFNYLLIAVGTAPSGTDDPEVTVCF